ncbi:phosphatidate cytidylyltransferase [Mycoplasmopsis verecunda]|uniref:Phosphatidate cytidylyltransferase n=1 Tax=Mycoplasmopsis verecunda TaxID=171291 RepID=A0A1T4LGW6_9BACT|nr:phosphatidate cytidylyltransferase [Mycoplasmopsis verecunda]WPB54614.1 phosphatidate cytidylyltransferase [Mycoplasmopsis verecunda]SJZ54029.1 phosphatidate cytidylyltransferase [Mycoplasmopsis verecunda]
MQKIQKDEKKNFYLNRFIPAIVLVVILIALLVIMSFSFRSDLYANFSNAGFWVLRITSVLLLGLISGWIFYELSKAYSHMLVPSIILTIFFVGSLMLGPDMFTNVLFGHGKVGQFELNINRIDNPKDLSGATYFGYLLTAYVFDFWTPLTSLIIVLIFFLIRLIVIKNLNMTGLIYKTFSLWFISLIVTIFIKMFVVLMTQPYGIELILLMIVIASSYDMGGYFGGKFLGHKFIKAKLAPAISPKKTWEGAFVGYVVSFIATILYIYIVWGIRGQSANSVAGVLNNISSRFFPFLLVFLFVAPVIALFGDLYFSLVKRRNEIKDFSNILKEHGGVLDRIDSISFVFVFFGILGAFSVL